MLKKILIALVVAAGLFAAYVATRPPDFRVARSIVIKAQPKSIFPLVSDLEKMRSWSPWEKLDPGMKRTYSDKKSGIGAFYEWSGNKDVGQGRMTVMESRPNELVRFKLEFIKPFPATHASEFVLQPQGNQTEVTWAMSGKKNFVSKAFCVFMDMDKMVGKDFENGLSILKAGIEGPKRG